MSVLCRYEKKKDIVYHSLCQLAVLILCTYSSKSEFFFKTLLKTFAGWLRFLLDHYHVRHFFLKRLETDINVPLSIWEYNISIVLTTMNAMSSHNASPIEFSPEVENPKQWLTNVLANIVDISLSSQAIFCCSLGFFLCSF